MDSALIWDETKRKANLAKHGLDFADAAWVLQSDIRMDVAVVRNDQDRIQSFAYVFGRLAVLSLVQIPQDTAIRIISFRTASKKERHTMNGSPMISRNKALAALQHAPPSGDFVWDGIEEDERPLTAEEMRTSHAEMKRRGRPTGSSKVSTTIRFDAEVLDAFRSSGPGWQSRMNAALREWLDTHPIRG